MPYQDQIMRIASAVDEGSRNAAIGNLVYPSDVGTMSRSEHFVQFFIRETTGARASLPKGSFATDRVPGTVPRPPTQRISGSITLYMPAQIQVSQKANYGEAEIGFAVAGAIGAAKGISGGLDNINWASLGSTVAEAGGNAIASSLETAGATGATAAKSIIQGRTTNNRTEMKFEGIDRRAFQFSFRLLPRSEEEAKQIQQIVKMFRLHSMPSFYGGDALGRTLVAPSTFDIEYNPSHTLHKISTSVLEAVDVKFGGERPQFFRDGQPVETELTLSFKELDIVTKEKVAQGF